MSPEPMPTAKELIDFLHGIGPLDGVYFGERPEGITGSFWWRKYLSVLAPPPDSATAGEVVAWMRPNTYVEDSNGACLPDSVRPAEKEEWMRKGGKQAEYASLYTTPLYTRPAPSETSAPAGVGVPGKTELLIRSAVQALKSYQYGNSSPDLAEEVAESLEKHLLELRSPPSASQVTGEAGPICECDKCGRSHRHLQAGTPPWGLSHADLCRLSQMFNSVAYLGIGTPDERINNWLKSRLAAAAPSSPSGASETKGEEA